MTATLKIEYVLEGEQRGYRFTTPTQHIPDDTLRAIWRNAMPRGQGWGGYVGAQSLKCFPVDDAHWALSETTVTDQQDESGRRGIRHTSIQLMRHDTCVKYLRSYVEGFERNNRQHHGPPMRAITDKAKGKLHGDKPLILLHNYTTAVHWAWPEVVTIMVALSRIGIFGGALVPFTTLALDPREELQLVTIPRGQTLPASKTTQHIIQP
jgi:hypothetical protein